MKKLIALFLAAILCFSLGACGGEAQTDGNVTQQPNDRFTITEDSVCSVLIKINPEFEIYLNENGKITIVEYLNADAEKAFSNVDVKSDDFEIGFRKLLDAAYENGYMNGNSVQITWTMYKSSNTDMDESSIVDGFAKVTEEFSNNTGIGFAVSAEGIVIVESTNGGKTEEQEQQQVSQEEEQVNLDERFTEYERDAHGNIIRTLEGVRGKDSLECFYDSDGNLTRELIETPDMREERLYKNGVLASSNVDYSDGSNRQTTFYANGQIATEKDETAEGVRYYERHYDESGNFTYSYDVAENGGSVETIYHENGNVASAVHHLFTGEYIEERYYEDGTMSYFHQIRADQTYMEQSYDTNGNITSDQRRELLSDGSYVERTYRPNGTIEFEYVYNTDGTVWYNEFDANGKQILEAQKQIQ